MDDLEHAANAHWDDLTKRVQQQPAAMTGAYRPHPRVHIRGEQSDVSVRDQFGG